MRPLRPKYFSSNINFQNGLNSLSINHFLINDLNHWNNSCCNFSHDHENIYVKDYEYDLIIHFEREPEAPSSSDSSCYS